MIINEVKLRHVLVLLINSLSPNYLCEALIIELFIIGWVPSFVYLFLSSFYFIQFILSIFVAVPRLFLNVLPEALVFIKLHLTLTCAAAAAATAAMTFL